MVKLKQNRKAGLGVASAFLILILVGSIGFFVVYSDDYLTIEARISNPSGSDPITATVDVRVTNHYKSVLVVNHVSVTVWADEERTIQLAHEEISGVVVQPGKQIMRSLTLEITNADTIEGTVWIDFSSVWTFGDEEPQTNSVTGRPFNLNGALDRVFGREQLK